MTGQEVRVAGWAENIRDHGGIKFVDLRDHYGTVKVTFRLDEALTENVTRESCVSVRGKIVKRSEDTFNEKISTGTIELEAADLDIIGKVTSAMPFETALSKESGEDVRLKYRFLDLRNRKVHDTITFRSNVITYIREEMNKNGYLELQTPIITASSPEGARDYIIPSRKHHGKFYALPQAPQIFKQLLMVSGFDKYYQIAPCFRDEDARADRTAGEFYQLDMELSFAEQEDVFAAGEKIISAVLEKFGKKPANPTPYPRISYNDAMLKYGSDKPDLRNPLVIAELSDLFAQSEFKPFSGKTVRGIRVPEMARESKKFFKDMEEFALSIGMGGLGYVKADENGAFLGPIDKFLTDDVRTELRIRTGLENGDVLYFIADGKKNAEKFAGKIRSEVAARMNLIDNSEHRCCWVYDFPMYEEDENTHKPAFSHNPFSLPQGGKSALDTQNPYEIKAYQYDFILDGAELASGAVRNHEPETMLRAFEIAGYSESDVKARFGALYNAFKYGAPPHAGMAFGLDRLVMLLLGEENVREVIAFPLGGNGQDLLLGAPSEVTELQLRETHISVRKKM
jgi:aspartyl-tRNA synthetase